MHKFDISFFYSNKNAGIPSFFKSILDFILKALQSYIFFLVFIRYNYLLFLNFTVYKNLLKYFFDDH